MIVEQPTVFLPDFGEDATLAGVAVRGLFDAQPADALAGLVGYAPTFRYPSTTTPARGALLVVRGRNWSVRAAQNDYHGWITLELQEAA